MPSHGLSAPSQEQVHRMRRSVVHRNWGAAGTHLATPRKLDTGLWRNWAQSEATRQSFRNATEADCKNAHGLRLEVMAGTTGVLPAEVRKGKENRALVAKVKTDGGGATGREQATPCAQGPAHSSVAACKRRGNGRPADHTVPSHNLSAPSHVPLRKMPFLVTSASKTLSVTGH